MLLSVFYNLVNSGNCLEQMNPFELIHMFHFGLKTLGSCLLKPLAP